MIIGNNINRFLRGCSDHREQLFCLFELKKLPWPYGLNLGLNPIEKIFSNLKKAGLASRNIVHLKKILLRCVDFCFYFLLFFLMFI